jgi:tetratricopeptide (TPR) repeat protein
MWARGLTVGALLFAGCHTLLGPPPPELTTLDESEDALTLAAECLQRGEKSAAAVHLETHVRRHPDQPMFRAHLAELLWKLDRPADARTQFERFVADAQDGPGPVRGHLVHCHTRLMEIARDDGDRYAEVFHRGVGLLRLVEQPGADEVGPGEEVLCQAVKALAEARDLRPGDPRPLAYLALAHDRAGNPRAAAAARAAARNTLSTAGLTPAERRGLTLTLGD